MNGAAVIDTLRRYPVDELLVQPYTEGRSWAGDYSAAVEAHQKLQEASGNRDKTIGALTQFIFARHSDILDLPPRGTAPLSRS